MNTTNYSRNGTGELPQVEGSPQAPNEETKAIIAAAYGVVFVVAMVGNPFVIHVAYNRLTTRSPFNILVINLAVCDMLYAMIAVSVQVGYLYMDFTWFQGGFAVFLCKFKEFSLVFVISVSVFTLVAMAVDRYFAVAHALKKPLTKHSVQVMIGMVWGISSLLSAPELYKYRTVSGRDGVLCRAIWSTDPRVSQISVRAEFTSKLIIHYVIPLVAMATLYGLIIRFLWKRNTPELRLNNNQGKLRKKFRKIVLTLVSMVIVFTLGWLPVHVVHLLIQFSRSYVSKLPFVVYLLMFWTAHANCAINPCLYLAFNNDYRDELRKVVQRVRTRCACCSARRGDVVTGLLRYRRERNGVAGGGHKTQEGKTTDVSAETLDTKL